MQTLQVNTTLNNGDIKVNPEYQAIVPPLSNEEYSKLKVSIEKNGLYEPIIINTENVILDGHHRFKACEELGVIPRYTVKKFKTPLHEKKYVIETNVMRRQLTIYARLELEVIIIDIETCINENLEFSQFEKTTHFVLNDINMDNKAREFGTSKATLYRAIYVLKNATEEIKQKARLPPEKGGITTFNAFKLTKQLVEKPTEPLPMPEGIYNVIYVDPPWTYTHSFLAGSPNSHYPTMTTEEICELEIPTNNDAVIFLWTTNPLLPDAFRVLEAWGFTYKTNICWVKDRPGTGHYVRGQHELLLIAVKGNIGTPPTKARIASVIHAPKTEHSHKPEEFYDVIEAMYQGKYLELFATEERKNWVSWGLEV